MKKITVSALFVVIVCISMAAQNSIFHNPDNKAYFGIRAGGDITCPGNVSVDDVGFRFFNNGGGIEFGGIYNVPLVANLYIEPGLKFFYDTYSLKNEWLELIQDDIIFNSMSIRKFGMRIPVMAGYHFDFTQDISVSVFTGPELEIGFSGKGYIKGYNIETSESVYGHDGALNRVNVLWGIGAGMAYRRVYFGINGGIGMTNMLSDSDAGFHENRVTISLGYNF